MTKRPLTAIGLPQLCVLLSVTLALLWAGAPRVLAAGVVPPANPASDCDRSGQTAGTWGVASIDGCRAAEGIGALALPANWSSLTPVQQGFVLIDLERVNRGLSPIVGLSASLDAYATRGADSQTDPPFPSTGTGGGIWAGGGTVFGADTMWLYDDGPGGFDANEDCSSSPAECWGHRDIILGSDGGGPLVAGGGFYGSGGYGSFAYLIMSHYPTGGLIFTWAHELRYFQTQPRAEALGSAAAYADQTAASEQAAATQLKNRRRHRRHKGATITVTFT
jgi:hypothetical protein